METVRIILGDKLYVPKEAFRSLPKLEQSAIKKTFLKRVFDPNLCEVFSMGRKCNAIEALQKDNPGASPQIACRKCPQSKEVIKCMGKSKKYYSFYRGNMDEINKVINTLRSYFKVTIDDRRVRCDLDAKNKFKSRWDLMGEPRKTEQKRVARAWWKKKFGVTVCPPRFGKTVLASLVAAKSKMRVAVFAHQRELLEQFRDDWLQYSTLKPKHVKINPKPEEVEKLSVALYTYQQFISKYGKDRIKEVRKKFGIMICDEVHMSGATRYTDVMNSFYAMYRMGVTATYARRDQKEFRVSHTFGPIVIEGGSEMLTCDYIECNSGWIAPQYKQMRNREWNYLWAAMMKAEKRNAFIADLVIQDLEANHKIVIPMRRIQHIKDLAKLIRVKAKQKGFYNIKVLEYTSGAGGSKAGREQVGKDIRAGKYDVVVAIAGMISLGFNAPPMSAIYLNAGGYHFNQGKLYQEYSRVRTPHKGKQTPLIRIIKDKHSISERSAAFILRECKSKGFNELEPLVLRTRL